jgi:hypothetical protein
MSMSKSEFVLGAVIVVAALAFFELNSRDHQSAEAASPAHYVVGSSMIREFRSNEGHQCVLAEQVRSVAIWCAP